MQYYSSKMIPGLLVLQLGYAYADATGSYVATVTADEKAIMKKAVTPEHSKLLAYAITQQKNAKNILDLKKDHTFLQEYDNGYGGDHTTLMGKWSETATELILSVEMVNGHKNRKPKAFKFPYRNGQIAQRDFLIPKQFLVTFKRKV